MISLPEATAEYWQTLEMSKKNYKRVFNHRLKVHISPQYISYYVNTTFIRRFCLFRIFIRESTKFNMASFHGKD